MNKISIEFKKWYQVHSSSQVSASGIMDGHILPRNWISISAIIRCGQFIGSALLAGGLCLMNIWTGDGVRLLVVLSATSALVYIGLAMQSRTGAFALLNLIAVPSLFATAYAGMNVAAEWLIISFILHGSVCAVQISSLDKDLSNWLFCWSVFNSVMALFLLLV
jgi:hypothetical protein